MLLDARHLAQGFLWSEEPGKVFPYAGIAVYFYESVAVLGHEAPLAALRGSPITQNRVAFIDSFEPAGDCG
jgi:hypothetical protein